MCGETLIFTPNDNDIICPAVFSNTHNSPQREPRHTTFCANDNDVTLAGMTEETP